MNKSSPFVLENTFNDQQKIIKNRRVVLNSRQIGKPVADSFKLEECEIPSPVKGQVLL